MVFDENYLINVSTVPYVEKVVVIHRMAAIEFGTKVTGRQFKGRFHILLTDLDVSLVITFRGSQKMEHSLIGVPSARLVCAVHITILTSFLS